MKVISVNVTPTTDTTLPAFDNTKLVAINTCPTWGIVRYTKHKTFTSGVGRAMALEAGGAAHEVFAAHRLYCLQEFGSAFYSLPQSEIDAIVDTTGLRIFGSERYEHMRSMLDDILEEDFRTRSIRFCLDALYSCGFYDDPSDRKRTVTNIEELCIAYMDKFTWDREVPVILKQEDGTYYVGIEILVDITLDINYMDDYGKSCNLLVRFYGKTDGLHFIDRSMDAMRVHENKTASRLGDAWDNQWDTNHQPTGYMFALSSMLGIPIRKGLALGTMLPMPVSYSLNGISRVPINRTDWQIEEWLEWLVHTVVELHNKHVDDPAHAPQYTHSCNRYFRSCMFIPLCGSPPDERPQIIDEMRVDEWNPLKEHDGPVDE